MIGGEIAVSDESTEVRFIRLDELDSLPIHDTVRLRLQRHLTEGDSPYLG